MFFSFAWKLEPPGLRVRGALSFKVWTWWGFPRPMWPRRVLPSAKLPTFSHLPLLSHLWIFTSASITTQYWFKQPKLQRVLFPIHSTDTHMWCYHGATTLHFVPSITFWYWYILRKQEYFLVMHHWFSHVIMCGPLGQCLGVLCDFSRAFVSKILQMPLRFTNTVAI